MQNPVMAALVALGCLVSCVVEEVELPDEEVVESPIDGVPDSVRVHAILTANDDGTQAAAATAADIQAAIAGASTIFAQANITLTFDPASDVSTRNSTLLNHDCSVAPGTNLDTGSESIVPPQDCASHDAERSRVARGYPGKLVLYFSTGDRLRWDAGARIWVYGPRGFNWSSGSHEFVALLGSAPHPEAAAHEMGHYFHLPHTFGPQPKTVAEAKTILLDYIERTENILGAAAVFDYDGIADTPPDPGPAVFTAAGLDVCAVEHGTLVLRVRLDSGILFTYRITPDRENIMSYWNRTCRGLAPHLSNGQVAVVRAAVEQQNRKHLVDPKVLYSAVWEPGARNQTFALGLAFGDFAQRFMNEYALGRHAVQVQAHDVGGQIRWNGVWEPGSRGQSAALGWTFADIVGKHGAELSAGRHLVHMQAYDLGGGQLRWDAIWEPGSTNQSWVMGWALPEFGTVFDQQIAAGRHLVHMQVYTINGSPRYDAVWEPGARGTTRVLAASGTSFGGLFNLEASNGKRAVHIQAIDYGGGQVHWDGVWEDAPPDFATTGVFGWAFNDFVARLQIAAAIGQHLVHMQAYDAGGGRVRYDGVWESGALAQRRILSESRGPFAARFDAETAAGMHVVMLQGHTGR
jgi:hypothetical protein